MKKIQKPASLSDNAFALRVLAENDRIDHEAKGKKLAQLEPLKSAKASILARMNELDHQLTQIDRVIAIITGAPTSARTPRKQRRNLDEVRDRVARWLEGHKGQKFMAGELIRQFSELQGAQVSLFMKPLIATQQVKTDMSEGPRRPKYFVEA